MIEYIIISYLIMALVCFIRIILNATHYKFWIKSFVLAPLSMPTLFLIKFINW